MLGLLWGLNWSDNSDWHLETSPQKATTIIVIINNLIIIINQEMEEGKMRANKRKRKKPVCF